MFEAELEVAEALEVFQEAAAELTRDLRVAVDESAKDGANEARSTKRYQNRTGELSASIRGTALSTGPTGAEGVVEAGAPHASYVNDGTQPHEIVGRPLLRFQTRDGRWVTTHSVRHPGTDPDGFMDRGQAKAEQALTERSERAVERFRQKLER